MFAPDSSHTTFFLLEDFQRNCSEAGGEAAVGPATSPTTDVIIWQGGEGDGR